MEDKAMGIEGSAQTGDSVAIATRQSLAEQSNSIPPEAYLTKPEDFDRDALNAVVWGASGNPEEGWCPNWEIPARIPHQRLQGLKRRGLLRFSPQRGWALSPAGENLRANLNAQGTV